MVRLWKYDFSGVIRIEEWEEGGGDWVAGVLTGGLAWSPHSTLYRPEVSGSSHSSPVRAPPPHTPHLTGSKQPQALVMVTIYFSLWSRRRKFGIWKYSQHFTDVKWGLRGLSCSREMECFCFVSSLTKLESNREKTLQIWGPAFSSSVFVGRHFSVFLSQY